MERKNNIKFSILAVILIIIFAFAVSPRTLQNDTYYTIKIGELIVNNGIDMQDHFSWHEDLPYTYPHWAYDTGMYFIYHLGETSGIADGGMVFIYISTIVFTSILGILLYFTSVKISKNRLVSFILTLAVLYLVSSFIAARAQLVTFIFFVLTILFIESFLESKKKRYLVGLVLVSFIIANLHVAVWPFFFILFMPYIAEYWIAAFKDSNVFFNLKKIDLNRKIRKIKERLEQDSNNGKLKGKLSKIEYKLSKLEKKNVEKIEKKKNKEPYKIVIKKNDAVLYLILVMVICLFTGLLTPLKGVPYTYLYNTMKGNTTKSISEHLPLTLYEDIKTAIVLVSTLAILIFTKTKIKLSDLLMVGGLIFLSFMSRRQTSMLFIIGMFTFVKLIDSLLERYDKDGCRDFQDIVITNTGKVVTILLVIIISIYLYTPKKDNNFVNSSNYPVAASTWILENLDVENIKLFNEYNYGSYLLFRGIPVFIDSRADLYAPEFNYYFDENGEKKSRDIFSDYMNISTISTYYENKFEQYGITHVIIRKRAKLNLFLSRNSKYNQLYSDNNFVVYEILDN